MRTTISLAAMTTRGRSSFVKLTVLAVSLIFVLLLLLTTLHSTDVSLRQQLPPKMERVQSLASPIEVIEEPFDEELVRQLEYELPEVDYGFWTRYAKPHSYRKNSTCAQYPDPLELQLHNTYWQTFINANVTFRLYAAYMDIRPGVKLPLGVVRILATANQIHAPFPPTHCQLWYAGHKEPIMTRVSEYLSVWVYVWGHTPLLSYPHLLSCPVPELPLQLKGATPRVVSLVSDSCDRASNSLRVHFDRSPVANTTAKPKASANVSSLSLAKSSGRPSAASGGGVKLNFGVCVKAFDFPYVDLSARLIEWFELQRLLGASRIYAYIYDVHPAVQRVLDYYQRIGFLELRPLTMANGMPRLRHYQHQLLQHRRLIKRLNELIPYNDCFYRNMYRHDYMLNVDIDEVIMPLGKLHSWQDVVDADEIETRADCPNGHVSLCFINTYFIKTVPEALNHEQLEADELYVLQHTLRHRNYSLPNRATKCFHNTRYSVTLHNHFTLKWLPGGCSQHTLSTQLAQMQHYREPDVKYDMSEVVEDRSVWRYANQLRAAVEYAWLHLNDVQEQVANMDEDQNTLDELPEQETDLEQAQEQHQVLEQTHTANAAN
ncbi:uncharacterized protein LOC6584255 [Drosophila mojavensis]|uniref:Glycosyltransferase family 92 protein n=1 Tax=Drosophila mojavensis TaxID=7230 RepID=B4L3V0_DROMO|nr:uncharacterized protein LOC6584255 [Drosophila mojavensis]EDW07228.2 uncharacterized protein Dmoj_GI14981 [Drosophila mojavensis]